MSKGKIVLIALGFIVLCLAYYCLVPKYEFMREGAVFFRCNRITGRVEFGGQPNGKNIKPFVLMPGRVF